MRLLLFIANVSGTIYSPTKEVIAYIRFLLCLCFSLSAVFAVYNHAEEKYSKMIFMTKHRMDRALIEDKQGNRIHTHAHINPKNHGIGFDWSPAINLPCVSAPVSLCLHWSVTRGGIGWFRFWTALYVCVCVCVCVLWKEREESNIIKHDKPLVFFLFYFFISAWILASVILLLGTDFEPFWRNLDEFPQHPLFAVWGIARDPESEQDISMQTTPYSFAVQAAWSP